VYIYSPLREKTKINADKKEHTDRDQQITYYTKLAYTITLKTNS